MPILREIIKNNEEYVLSVSQDTTYILNYILKNSKQEINSGVILENESITLSTIKDGEYELILSAENEEDITDTLKVIKNLQSSIILDVLTVICDYDAKYSSSTNCLTKNAKELLQVRNIFNKILTYQSIYLADYGDSYLAAFNQYITRAIKLSNCDIQEQINSILIDECIGSSDSLNFKLFKSYIYLYWTGFYFTDIANIGVNNTDTKEYVDNKYFYNNITECSCCLCYDIAELKTIYDTLFGYIDPIAPIITLLGDSNITINEGEVYTDAGATALDNVDGDITANIVIVNNVNTGVLGNYQVTYNVQDAAGNSATEVVRTIAVINPVPADIINLTATINGTNDGISFNWDVTEANTSSMWEFSDDSTFATTLSTGGGSNSLERLNLSANTYYFRVKAVRNGVASANWVEISSTISEPSEIFYGATISSLSIDENFANAIANVNTEYNNASYTAYKQNLTGNDSFVFNWNDESGTNYNKVKHFILFPTVNLLGAVDSDAFGGEVFHRAGGNPNVYTTSTLTINGIAYSLYVYSTIAPINANITINF